MLAKKSCPPFIFWTITVLALLSVQSQRSVFPPNQIWKRKPVLYWTDFRMTAPFLVTSTAAGAGSTISKPDHKEILVNPIFWPQKTTPPPPIFVNVECYMNFILHRDSAYVLISFCRQGSESKYRYLWCPGPRGAWGRCAGQHVAGCRTPGGSPLLHMYRVYSFSNTRAK